MKINLHQRMEEQTKLPELAKVMDLINDGVGFTMDYRWGWFNGAAMKLLTSNNRINHHETNAALPAITDIKAWDWN